MSTPYTKETTCRKVEAISPGKQIVTNFESTSQYEQPVAHLKTTSQAKQFIANFTLEQYPATRNFGMERGMQNGYHLLLAGILLCSGLESLDAKQHHLELETIAKSISTVFPIAVSVEDIADHARQITYFCLQAYRTVPACSTRDCDCLMLSMNTMDEQSQICGIAADRLRRNEFQLALGWFIANSDHGWLKNFLFGEQRIGADGQIVRTPEGHHNAIQMVAEEFEDLVFDLGLQYRDDMVEGPHLNELNEFCAFLMTLPWRTTSYTFCRPQQYALQGILKPLYGTSTNTPEE